jgi:hypothetical protein
MALPRRPNLLALFPGISNDWQAAEDGAEKQRVGEREREMRPGRRKRQTDERNKRLSGK